MNYTRHTDQELLRLIQKKDEEAFKVLFDRYYEALFKNAYVHLPSPTLVEEMVEDVFVNFWKKAGELDTQGNVRAYLYATLRNIVLHHLRSERTRSFYLRKLRSLRTKPNKAESIQKLFYKETEEKIKEAIDSLSPKCREAFTLSRYEDLSYMEIAEKMNISVNTVENHISKALKILRRELNFQ